jgi:hypothetical protein
MSSAPFHIRPAWPDFMVYEEEGEGEGEGEARSIQFDCRSMDEPPQVSVPAARQWNARMPPWAWDARERIVGRLRAAGCIVFEEDGDLTTALSPDGTVRIALHRVDDERSGLWVMLQITDAASGELVLSETNYRTVTLLRFPRAGVVDVSLTDRTAQRRHFEVDVAARSFRMHPADIDEPLALLPARLGRTDPRPYVAPAPDRPLLRRILAWVCALASLVLVAGGAWMIFAGASLKDRGTGALGVLFFGACAVSFLKDWPRRRSAVDSDQQAR